MPNSKFDSLFSTLFIRKSSRNPRMVNLFHLRESSPAGDSKSLEIIQTPYKAPRIHKIIEHKHNTNRANVRNYKLTNSLRTSRAIGDSKSFETPPYKTPRIHDAIKHKHNSNGIIIRSQNLSNLFRHRHFTKIDNDNTEKRKMVELIPFKIGIKKIPIPSGPSKAHPFRPFNPNHRTFRYDFTETVLTSENEIKFQVFDVDKPTRVFGEISFDNAGDNKIYGKKNFTVILKPENSLQIICYSRKERQFKHIELFHYSKYDEVKKLRCVIL